MNEFNEDKWSAEQRALDLAIHAEFESIEQDFSTTSTPDTWADGCAPRAAALFTMIKRITHAGRREHWYSVMHRLTLVEPPPPMVEDATTTAKRPKGGVAQ